MPDPRVYQAFDKACPRLPWWQWGRIAGRVLLQLTAINAAIGFIAVLAGAISLRDYMIGVPLVLGGVAGGGFALGVLGWVLYRLLGWAGGAADAAIGVIVMLAFFAGCWWAFDDANAELVGDRGAMLFFGTFAVVVGGGVGFWVGRSLRREWAEQRDAAVRSVELELERQGLVLPPQGVRDLPRHRAGESLSYSFKNPSNSRR